MQRYVNLFKEIDKIKPISILEIGTWDANHATQMIAHAKKYNPVYYVGFDLFEKITESQIISEFSKPKKFFQDSFKKLEMTGCNFDLICGNTRDTLKEFGNEKKFDLIFIDGGHSFQTVANDWYYCKQMMHEKSIVLFDDYYLNENNFGCNLTIDSIDRSTYKVEFLDPIDTCDFLKIQMVRVTLSNQILFL